MGLQAERLYYTDSYLREFASVVEEIKQRDGETWVHLRESAFYPTSGGQPFDTGMITVADAAPASGRDAPAALRVIAVEVENGQVWHRISDDRASGEPGDDVQSSDAYVSGERLSAEQNPGRPLEVGQAVIGHIDWTRRFDFMQQHSGQHILSACFEQMLGANTTSFHMGDTYSSIDLDLEALSDEQLRDVVWEANCYIWRDVPIRARFVSEAELAAMHLRKAPSVAEDIRIVTIEGLEDNACGGTHPSSSGQVGQILVTKTERMRGGVRVTFACGERALSQGKEAVDLVRQIATDLSVGPADLAATIASLQAQVKEANRKYDDVRSRYASLLARDFAANQTRVVGGTRVLFAILPDPDEVPDLKRMALAAAERLAADHPGEAQLVVFAGEIGGRTHLVAQATDGSGSDGSGSDGSGSDGSGSDGSGSSGSVVTADGIIKTVLPALGGKGGGNAKAAQGSAPASAQQVADLVESALAQRDQAERG